MQNKRQDPDIPSSIDSSSYCYIETINNCDVYQCCVSSTIAFSIGVIWLSRGSHYPGVYFLLNLKLNFLCNKTYSLYLYALTFYSVPLLFLLWCLEELCSFLNQNAFTEQLRYNDQVLSRSFKETLKKIQGNQFSILSHLVLQ